MSSASRETKTSGLSQCPNHWVRGATPSMALSTTCRSVKLSRYRGMKPKSTLIMPQKPEKMTSNSTKRQLASTMKTSAKTLPRVLPDARSSAETGSLNASRACTNIRAHAAADTQKT